jgi:quercetin dioxygenase-like cupin family protein
MDSLPTLADTGLMDMPRNPSLAQIQAFEAVLRQLPNQLELENYHHFSDGVYLRELVIPAGAVLVGKLHKTRHFLLITRGRIQCKTDAGMVDLEAGDIIETHPGTKRVLLAYEDSVMVTIHVTSKTDLAEIEKDVIEPETPAIEGVGE